MKTISAKLLAIGLGLASGALATPGAELGFNLNVEVQLGSTNRQKYGFPGYTDDCPPAVHRYREREGTEEISLHYPCDETYTNCSGWGTYKLHTISRALPSLLAEYDTTDLLIEGTNYWHTEGAVDEGVLGSTCEGVWAGSNWVSVTTTYYSNLPPMSVTNKDVCGPYDGVGSDYWWHGFPEESAVHPDSFYTRTVVHGQTSTPQWVDGWKTVNVQLTNEYTTGELVSTGGIVFSSWMPYAEGTAAHSHVSAECLTADLQVVRFRVTCAAPKGARFAIPYRTCQQWDGQETNECTTCYITNCVGTGELATYPTDGAQYVELVAPFFEASNSCSLVGSTVSLEFLDFVLLYDDRDGGPPCMTNATCCGGPLPAGRSSGFLGASGMPYYWVSEPYINLWVEDRPVQYTTSLGEVIAFQATCKQRDTRPGAPGPDGSRQFTRVPPTGWGHNWFSYAHVKANGGAYDAWVYGPEGGVELFNSSQALDLASGVQVMPMDGNAAHVLPPEGEAGMDVYGRTGLRVVHSDGSQDLYGQATAPYPDGSADLLLTERVDAFGNSIHLTYTNADDKYYLHKLVDYDGRITSFTYLTNWLLTRVDMPYGRFATFDYNEAGQVVQITDALGLASTFTYQNNYIATLGTPYGTTRFEYTEGGLEGLSGSMQLGPQAGRAIRVTKPNGAKELYLYCHDVAGKAGIAKNLAAPVAPGGWFDDNFLNGAPLDVGAEYYRNSFRWDSRHYEALSTTDLEALTPADYALATTTHWLLGPGWLELSPYPAWVREPSSDGSTPGAVTWFSYRGQDTNALFALSAFSPGAAGAHTVGQPVATARLMPGGKTWFEFVAYNNTNNQPEYVATAYEDATPVVSVRTNTFAYETLAGSETCQSGATNLSTANWRLYALQSLSGPDGTTLLSLSPHTNVVTTVARQDAASNTYAFTTSLPRWRDLAVTDAASNITHYFFNDRQQVSGWKLPTGLTGTNLYGADGFLALAIALEIQASNSFAFADGLPSVIVNSEGLARAYTWDKLERLTSVSYPDGTWVSNVYSRLDLASQKDRLGNWTSAEYNAMGQVTNLTDALGHATRFDYCTCGALESITGPLTNTTTFARDLLGRLTRVLGPDGFTEDYGYDEAGRLVTHSSSAGLALTYVRNLQGLVTRVDAPSTVWQAAHDIYDRPVSVTDGDNFTRQIAYDALGRVTTNTLPDQSAWAQVYAGRLLSAEIDPNQHITRYGYDTAGRLASVTNANQEITRFTHSPAGRLLTLTDGNGHTTSWNYDAYGRATNKVDATRREIFRWAYDPAGRLTNGWTPQAGNIVYAHDTVGNLTNVVCRSWTNAYAYDAAQHLIRMADRAGVTVFGYTAAGMLSFEDGPWAGDTVTLTYTNRLRAALSLDAQPASLNVNYGYDELLRLKTVGSPAGVFSYAYKALGGRLDSLAYPNGAVGSFGYDVDGRLSSKALQAPSSALLDSYGYEYDPAGNRTSASRRDGTRVEYGYDAIDQLISARAFEPDGLTLRKNENFGYGYDRGGNLLSRTNNALIETFNTDTLNQLTTVTRNNSLTVSGVLGTNPLSLTVNGQPAEVYQDLTFASADPVTLSDGWNKVTIEATDDQNRVTAQTNWYRLPATVSYAYDSNGNMTSDGLHGCTWDAADQLVGIVETNAWKTEFVYDGLGRRRIARDYGWVWETRTWQLTNETRLVCDGLLPIQERSANNLARKSYTRGADLSGTLHRAGGIGGLLALTRPAGGGSEHFFYHADGVGNVTALMDGQGSRAAWYLYGPFGRLVGMGGAMAEGNEMRFSSMPRHANSGLSLYPFRAYDSGLQRWLTKDPIGERRGINLYGFVGNNPISRVDPLGLSWIGDYMDEVGKGIYDFMMGDSPGQYDQNTYGAMRAQMLGGIDRNDNVLRDSMGEGARLLGDLGQEAAKAYAGGKLAGALGGAVCRVGRFGGPAHREVVADIIAHAVARDLKYKKEFMFPAPGIFGTIFGAKFADVVVFDASGTAIAEIYQVGRVTAGGWPVAREMVNGGIIAERALMDVIFVPYNLP